MSKKILFPVVIALLIATTAGVWGYSDVAAQAGTPRARLGRLPGALGRVTSIGVDRFTLHTRAGQERTFRFDEATRFTDLERQQLSAGNLYAGGWVGVAVARSSGEPRLARLVVILPEGFNPADWTIMRGRVMDVDLSGSSFTLESQNGQATKVKVGAGTIYRGQITGLGELKVGMQAQTVAEKQANGNLLARVVRAGVLADQRFLGKVTAVNTHSFTIETRKGETVSFQLTGETRFFSRRVPVDKLEVLKVGMRVAVGAKELGNGRHEALRVLVAPGSMK